jgi:hypothetical protein
MPVDQTTALGGPAVETAGSKSTVSTLSSAWPALSVTYSSLPSGVRASPAGSLWVGSEMIEPSIALVAVSISVSAGSELLSVRT